MKIVGVIVLTLPAILRAQDGVAEKQNSRIETKQRGSQPPTEIPADHFTGRVRLEPLFQENDPDVWSPFALLVAQLAYDGKTAQSWRTVSSDLAKANEKHNQRAGN